MEDIFQLLLLLAQLAILLAEHAERKQHDSTNKKISPDDETKISISIKKG